MKIALCLSGQPRFIKFGYKFIKKYLLEPNSHEDIDIFLHAWYDPAEIGKAYSSAQNYPAGHVGCVEKDTDKFLINKFNPKKFKIEKQIDFKEYSKDFRTVENAKQDVMCSIFYSIYQSNELKKQYEKENNFVYDLVIRTRYDLAYYEPIIFSQHLQSLKKIAVLENYQTDQDMYQSTSNPIPDIFSFSNSKNMDIFCDVYENMKMLNSCVDIPYGERYLGEWVRNKNKVEIYKFNSKVVILHRMPQLKEIYK